jgi:lipopolysaccharide/colanic/teichoic acid biosynthesis glycosyltransferase
VIAARFSQLQAELMSSLSFVHFQKMPVYSLEMFYEKFWGRVLLSLIGAKWPFEANFVLVQNSIYSSLKRMWDFSFALIALILLIPVLLVIALAILICDGAPVFYSQPRMGIYQQPFILYKFRTMRVGSDQGDTYTREGDSRVTRLGAFLRKTRLDELPQLWNVLNGDMSVIGPRAEWVRLIAEYEKQIPYYHFRHLVRPGITGWAQVNYPYGASVDDTLQKLSFDLYYIRNFSMHLDAEVTLKTLYVILFGKGR